MHSFTCMDCLCSNSLLAMPGNKLEISSCCSAVLPLGLGVPKITHTRLVNNCCHCTLPSWLLPLHACTLSLWLTETSMLIVIERSHCLHGSYPCNACMCVKLMLFFFLQLSIQSCHDYMILYVQASQLKMNSISRLHSSLNNAAV